MKNKKVKFFQIAEWTLYILYGIVDLEQIDCTIFILGGVIMSQDLLFYVITTAITIAIGIITYFLKRTIDRNDKLEENVQELRDMQFTLSEKYATKAEVAEIKATMQKLNDSLDYIKEHTTKNEDFIRVMTRLESKIDNYLNK